MANEDDQENTATTYAKIGEVYCFKNDLESALLYEQRALDIFLPLNNPELSDIYRTMGRIYHNKKEFTLSLEQYKKALEVDRQHATENHYNFGITYESMGSTYHNSRNYRKAAEYFAKAREVYLKSLPPKLNNN